MKCFSRDRDDTDSRGGDQAAGGKTLKETTKLQMQLMMGLPGLPWDLISAILDTGAGPILIIREAILFRCVSYDRTIKLNRLRLVAGTSLQVTGSIQLLIQLGQHIIRTGFLVVENVLLDICIWERRSSIRT